uniref:Histone deacetylase n=1 Tax=Chlamydomonas leiostraca TaxID=1034604 RepID=A0A7S0RD65_9CHLO|mmetsp:Transcript_19563/g.49743  ORF Transcript_19563/g.49743 Transcript_19563/m.49743 type:complete len:429 (+) Transcript_19563:101-1387(+)
MVAKGKKRVTYFYDSEFQSFYFGQNHPMKPHRLAMTHHLVLGYGLHNNMQVFRPRKAYPAELAQFHTADYVEFLSRVTPDNAAALGEELARYNFNEDCPVFDGMFNFCQLYAGASLQGAQQLNHGLADIAINWSGGLHHAKKGQASGFCYVNDLVLAILELLRHHARVLYVDIDVHHGDGVEEAFYVSDRVMTVSFHKYGDYFFPGTGALGDCGELNGKYYAVNVPLKDGTTDDSFLSLFRPIMRKVMEVFQPGAIVMQCGADSLANDRLGCFNMSLRGHGEALRFMKEFGVPMLVTGGGGYIKSNVARCWAYETSILTETAVPEELPRDAYHEYYAPDFSLNVAGHKSMEDHNTRLDIDRIRRDVMERLRRLEHCPSVQMHELPPERLRPRFQYDEEDPPEERIGQYAREHGIIRDGLDNFDGHPGW